MDVSEKNTKPTKPWYKKWWFITLLVLVGLIIIIPTSDNKNNNTNQPTELVQERDEVTTVEPTNIASFSPEVIITSTTEPKVAVLNYQIVYEIDDKRYDGGKNYYLLIDKVNLNTDEFKKEIKKAVDEIVKSRGEKISIEFVNNKEILDIIYKSHYGINTLVVYGYLSYKSSKESEERYIKQEMLESQKLEEKVINEARSKAYLECNKLKQKGVDAYSEVGENLPMNVRLEIVKTIMDPDYEAKCAERLLFEWGYK